MANNPLAFPGYYRGKEVSPNFEEKVWRKIGKKRQRRLVGRIIATLALITALPLGYRFLVSRPAASTLATSDTHSLNAGKEQVPLEENFTFAVSDYRSVYALEPVSYTGKIRSRRNEI